MISIHFEQKLPIYTLKSVNQKQNKKRKRKLLVMFETTENLQIYTFLLHHYYLFDVYTLFIIRIRVVYMCSNSTKTIFCLDMVIELKLKIFRRNNSEKWKTKSKLSIFFYCNRIVKHMGKENKYEIV